MSQPLLIKQLSQRGEVLRTVSCAAGQVTVLRSVAPSDLKPFQRALAGASGSERFNITCGSEEYEPHLHLLIGFGEQFTDQQETVTSFLQSNDVPPDGVLPLLTGYGIERFSEHLCKDLPLSEARMVRLLAAIHRRGKILVLNDPFEPISSQWRERFAELIVQFARSTESVVIVSALSSRPECWIDNELIVRVQVGETRQKTIGFASAPSDIQEQIAQLREELSQRPSPTAHAGKVLTAANVSGAVATAGYESDAASASEPPLVAPTPQLEPEIWQRRLWRILTQPLPLSPLFLVVLVFGAGAIVIYRVSPSNEEPVVVAAPTESTSIDANEAAPSLLNTTASPSELSKEISAPSPEIAVAEPELAIAPPVTLTGLLDQYPSEIKAAVLASFDAIAITNVREADSASKPVTVPDQASKAGAEMLRMLEAASDTAKPGSFGESEASEPPPPPGAAEPTDQASWEQRREMMRQRFLESIQAASQQ